MFFFKSYGRRPAFRNISLFVIFLIVFSVVFPPLTVLAEETTQTLSSCSVTGNITHRHTGGSGGGGCYGTARTGTRTIEIECDGTMVYNPDTDSTGCSKCGAGYHGDQSGRGCWTVRTEQESYTYYELSCQKNTTDVLGTLTLTKSTDEWTKNLELTASYDNPQQIAVNTDPFLWNGMATGQTTQSVSENGLYTLQLHIDDHPDNYNASVSMDIRNIDYTPPVIAAYQVQPQEWTNQGVTFEALTMQDLQPDRTTGCGLAQYPFSYDNGGTWSEEDSYLYTGNGTHTVLLRDNLGNTSSIQFTIENIDATGPDITLFDYDHTQNIKETTLTVSANDILEDGREGVGLHEIPFSYDGGVTWTTEYELPIVQNGKISFAVRDRLGNITIREEKISNIYEPKDNDDEAADEETSILPKTTPTPIPSAAVLHVKQKRRTYEGHTDTESLKKAEYKTTATPTPTPIVSIKKEKEGKTITPSATPRTEPDKKRKFGVGEIIFLLSIVTIFMTGLSILIYLWYHSILIYNETENNQFERIGRQWIKKKDGNYEVVITEFILSQCNTTHFIFCPSYLFVLLKKERELFFLFPDNRCTGMKTARKMEMDMITKSK